MTGVLKLERREYGYAIVEFYALKKILHLLRDTEVDMKEAEARIAAGEVSRSQLEHMLRERIDIVRRYLSREERIEYRMHNIHQRLKHSVANLLPSLRDAFPAEAQHVVGILGQAEIYAEKLLKLDARRGDIEKALEAARSEPGKINDAGKLVKEALQDLTALETLLDELQHIDVLAGNPRDIITRELKLMFAADQAFRSTGSGFVPWVKRTYLGTLCGGFRGVYAHFDGGSVDKYNTTRLKKLFNVYPFEEIAKDKKNLMRIFFIVQHADHDLQFQCDMLDRFKKLPLRDDIFHHLAYLTDRVSTGLAKPQEYGTQWSPVDSFYALRTVRGLQAVSMGDRGGCVYGELTPASIILLNERRATVNLSSIRESMKKESAWRRRDGKIVMWLNK